MPFTKEQLEQLNKVHGSKPLFRLRWCFHYNDGKPPVRGVWNNATNDPKQMAAFVDKNNLASAVIEGEYIGNYSIHRLLEVDGQDYVSMSWVAGANVPAFFRNDTFKRRAMILGLAIISRNKTETVFIDGSKKERLLTDNEKQFKLEEHKR